MAKITNAKTRLRGSIKAQSKKVTSPIGAPIGLGLHLLSYHGDAGKRLSRRFEIGDDDIPLQKAFDAYLLDTADPSDWALLLRALAAVVEPELDALLERNRVGAKKKWTFARRFNLVFAIDRLQKSSVRKISDEEACRRLKSAADSPLLFREAKSAKALARQAVEGRKEMRTIAKANGRDLPAVLTGRKNRGT